MKLLLLQESMRSSHDEHEWNGFHLSSRPQPPEPASQNTHTQRWFEDNNRRSSTDMSTLTHMQLAAHPDHNMRSGSRYSLKATVDSHIFVKHRNPVVLCVFSSWCMILFYE